MALLKEILGTLSLDAETGTTAASDRPSEAQQKEDLLFLPSQLLDHSVNNPQFSLSGLTLVRDFHYMCFSLGLSVFTSLC